MSTRVPVREDLFAETADGPVLLGSRCGSCGKVQFPKVQSCPDCPSAELTDVPLSRRGRLFTYSIVQMPSTHFRPPYAVGYVDLPEGVRIFAPLEIREDKPFRIGMEVALEVVPLWQEAGKEVVGYKFKLV